MKLLPVNGGVCHAKVDDDVFVWASRLNWRLSGGRKKRYVYCTRGGQTIYLHREIMGNPKGLLVDHRFGDTLDCRRKNLRPATYAQNAANKVLRPGQLRGVRFRARASRWEARIFCYGRKFTLGLFPTAGEATAAYDRAALLLRGDFAWLHSVSDALTDRRSRALASMQFLSEKLKQLRDHDENETRAQELEMAAALSYQKHLQAQLSYEARRPKRKPRVISPLERGSFTPAAIAAAFGVPKKKVLEWIASGAFGCVENSRISREAVERFKASRRLD